MTSATIGNTTWNYAYRADGMRMSKKRGSGGVADTYYRYDGQMPREEFFWGSQCPKIVCVRERYMAAIGDPKFLRVLLHDPNVWALFEE
jgi:hypothetical protein